MTDRHRRRSLLGGALRGAIAGLVATWIMDLVTTGMLEGQSKETTERERAARPNGQSTVANLLDWIEAQTGTTLDGGQRVLASQVIHYLLGIVPGALYGA
ncbi:MAG: hypothetical protein FIA92_16265, partial [Chloroflexi bacterium]|nr:hypothetical protein [Chloroflexota bacterium]